MSERPKILLTDDDDVSRRVTELMLSRQHDVVVAADGETCLTLAEQHQPTLILLDIEMPGIDGYETCRRLKSNNLTADIPVMFLSGHDQLEDRLRGYEAGGDDYFVKPFDIIEITSKIRSLVELRNRRQDAEEMAQSAGQVAMTAITTLGEMGALLETLRAYGKCGSYDELAEQVLAGLSSYGMHGLVQVRNPNGAVSRSHEGDLSPLQASVLANVTGMGRLVQFKSRLAINFDRVSLLVNDLPIEDEERCGRLRDLLAHLVEWADERAKALEYEIQAAVRTATIEHIISELKTIFAEFEKAQIGYEIATQENLRDFSDRIETCLIGFALTESQEEHAMGVIMRALDRTMSLESPASRFQGQIAAIIAELRAL